MTGKRFKYKLDRTCRIVTWSVLGALAVAVGLLWWLSPGAYLPVWFATLVAAVLVLVTISAPRSVRITEKAVEIRCVVEITHIPWPHIRGARRVTRAELGPLVPVFASAGFLGWFGYWLAPRTWDFIRVYAASWQGLVMIEDIYEQRFVVSADDPRALLREIEKGLERKKIPKMLTFDF